MGKDKRKATDILLSIEKKVTTILGYYKNMDNNIKLILSNINTANITLNQNNESDEDIPSINFPVKDKNTVVGEPIEDEEESEEITQAVTVKGNRRTSRTTNNNEPTKKVAVTQQILFPDGEPVGFANVEIEDSKGNTIKRTKTSPNGTWLAPLEAGEYKVYLRKSMSEDGTRFPVELKQQIEVPQSNKAIKLASPELPGEYVRQKD